MNPSRRQTIIKVSRAQDGWRGSINGYRAEITYGHDGAAWRVCINRRWIGGIEGTTWGAIESIEQAIRQRCAPSPVASDLGRASSRPDFKEGM